MNPINQLIELVDKNGLWSAPKSIKRGEFITVGGNIDTKMYLILEGSVHIYLLDEEEEMTIRFGYQGNLVAALDSYLSGKPSPIFIKALRTTTIKYVEKIVLQKLIETSPQYQSLWRGLLESFVLQQMEREYDLLTRSPIERYQRVFKRSPHLFQEVPHKYIAAYLRMTPETLSRVKRQ